MTTLLKGQISEAPQTSTFICAPIIGKPGDDVIGVCQLVNKRNTALPGNDVFSRADERLLEDFAVYCALGLEKFITQQMGDKTRANLDVTKEVLSYQISASQEELQALESLCQWVLSVRKGYRNVAYHNWSHALSTAQCMFAILQAEDELKNNLSSLEVLALMIACLSHDLDHRGVNNSYIEKSNQPLAQLYGHSSLEHHHFDMCCLILENPGSQILSSLSKKDYKACVRMIEMNILATDLTVYLEKRTMFFERAQNSSCLWKDEDHRELLRSMLMTASDICAITKPWPFQKRIAKLVATEFFAQGDREKCEFKTQPINVMDRENSTRLPHMQVDYIDGIFSPLFKALASIFQSCSPLLEGCRRNRKKRKQLVESGEEEERKKDRKGTKHL